MKQPKRARHWIKETENVIDKVFREINNQKREIIEKKDFEKVLDLVIGHISKNRGIAPEIIGKQTSKVVEMLTQFLEDMPMESRSWKAIIAFTYLRYHSELGLLSDDMMAKIHASTSS
ncbi:MAG: hypothetical protein QNJ55_19625 [Xenococcus sp. MO_188.B8]|nr:hypothetical protein [Xenococcus sp. MO_188.B8]